MISELKGLTAFVTGASSGLGRHFAMVLARHGVKVGIGARRLDRLSGVASEISAKDGQSMPLALDVTRRESVEAAVAECEARLGPIDILINAAGIAQSSSFLKTKEDDWREVLETNLTGTWRVSQVVAQRMVDRGRGNIVNIASIVGLCAQPKLAAYSVSKAGVAHLTRAMALELGQFGVRVNALAPGYFQTEMNENFVRSEAGQAYIARLFPRRLGEAEELDGALLLLVSRAGSFVNGTVLPVDGGTLLGGIWMEASRHRDAI